MHLPSEWWRAKLKTEGGELPLRRRFSLNLKSHVPLHSYEKRLEILTGLPAWNEDRWSKFVIAQLVTSRDLHVKMTDETELSARTERRLPAAEFLGSVQTWHLTGFGVKALNDYAVSDNKFQAQLPSC